MPQLIIRPDGAIEILLKAREFDVKVDETDPGSGSNASDDGMADVLEDHPDDPTHHELFSAIRDLNDDEQLDLIALIWIGRGDFALSDWAGARLAARDIGRARVPRYVTGIPLVSDFLEDGLAQFNHSVGDYLDRN